MDGLLFALTLVTALGAGLSAGALFAFSSFVMKALARLQPAQGIAAMQSINVQAPTPMFMTTLFGTGLASVVLAIWALVDWNDSYSPWLLAGSALYVLGADLLTMGYHVPRNNALARVEPDSAEGARLWGRYVTEWTLGNHVRVLGGLAGAAAFTIALQAG